VASQPNRRPGKAKGKRAELEAALKARGWTRVDEAEWIELQAALAPVSENYLRRLLRESGVALSPMVAGVRQGSFDELEASLAALLNQYEGGDVRRRAAVRKLVIVAKEHAQWAMRRAAAGSAKQAEKEEVTLWLTTWLENPGLFPEWMRLRKAAR
jgi:hypothetical protein